jgi:PD-(D/E)XK nuclease superfamily
MTNAQRVALDRFTSGNQELIQLKVLANRFNLFEALDVVTNERKHSKFLGFLLDPNGNHGLRDYFLKRFLQTAIAKKTSISLLTQAHIDVCDLTHATIETEKSLIDVFVSDPKNKLFVIIENKIDSVQHSDQLLRYYQDVVARHQDSSVFGVLLSRDDEEPEHPSYAPLTYADVRELVIEVAQRPDLHLSEQIKFALAQYTDVLGRHFMADEQLRALCASIYKQHKAAIDLIIENRPDQREIAREHAKKLIAQQGFILDSENKSYVRFIPKPMDSSYFIGEPNWTPSGRMLLFEFQFSPKKIDLILQMGYGTPAKREEIHVLCKSISQAYKIESTLNGTYHSLYRRTILQNLDSMSDDEVIEAMNTEWKVFVEDDLQKFVKPLTEKFAEMALSNRS